MAEVVKMPKLSDTMTEGVVSKWHKKVGDVVKSGQLLADIETDKATMEFESFQDGVLLYIGVEEGKGAPVDSILAILGEKGEDIKALLAGAQTAAPAAEKSTEKIVEKVAPAKATEVTKPEPVKPLAAAVITKTTVSDAADGRTKVSPLAKKLAEEKGIDIMGVRGSGDEGRIVKRDIENYNPALNYTGSSNSSSGFVGVESFTEEAVSQMRKTIARRLAESKFSAPHFYLTMEINMDKAIEARNDINESSPVKISFNDFVIKAAALALRKHPKINSSWLGDKIRFNQHIHIGVAVAVEDGLLVPVVRFADGISLAQLSVEVKSLGQKAKEKKLQPAEWEGNTFTISNLGMFGIDEFTAIINPPDACILAVGGIKQGAVVKNGQLAVGNLMKVTLSCDHRVVDGASGAAFLQTLKSYLEKPINLLL
ncbi:MAG: pyruvate dehydrogenase complex dihydrolipoamide acetyltransferase [Bacteroidetes bacterium]|nr:pyruvate dehydrogenase complex dihydrolipoamide acetyltransferase [Bacteroidota bacterium]